MSGAFLQTRRERRMEKGLYMTDSISERREAISVRGLWAGYENDPVLEDINLTVYERDYIGLMGPNGGGKTTLLKVILGLLEPSRGEVRLFGEEVRAGRRFVGYVPQRVDMDNEFPISVWDVALMGRLGHRRALRRYSREDERLVAQALEDAEVLGLKDRPIGELSGGQRQRVYIARALAARPRILLLDEPTASVDPQGRTHIYELLRHLNEQITIVLISHDISVVSSYVKTVGCLNHRLFYHGHDKLTDDMVAAAYQCPVDLIAHGLPHRVLAEHPEEIML